MIKGKVKIDNNLVAGVVVFESTETGIPLKRNNTYLSTTTNDKGEYSINLPINNTNFVTFKYVGTNGATLPTKKIPLTLILPTNNTLDEFEIKGKRTYYWLLLLIIPVIYNLSKKK
jgi:hypothetical protein